MFGYIQPNKDELRFREFNEYRAYYCGLCKCIGREFGEPLKLVLSYDCAFIALLLSGIGGSEKIIRRRCAYHPIEKPRLISMDEEYLRFAADMDILLAYHKLDDDWRDEKKLSAAAVKPLMKAAVTKAASRNPIMDKVIRQGLTELHALEIQNCTQLDAPADVFARMMREASRQAPIKDKGDRLAFSHLMYHLGRWVYLADAWDDRDKDKKRGSYNCFLASGADKDRAEFLLNCSLNEAIKAYELIDIKAHKGVLDNILFEGCTGKNKLLLGGKDEQSI